MKCYTYIKEDEEERVLIYAHDRTRLVDDIESLVLSSEIDLTGSYDNEIIKIDINDVVCFISENNKVYALVGDKKYQIKYRLYQIEELNLNIFIKVNQSCLANKTKIKRFESTIGGSLKVVFNNEYVDFIARRELKNVKKRMGL
ncbi:MAG: LytTR family transcriptional regulator DNA-binding domain-containing protein [Acholeplasmatales bacterium]|jgi:DNA-binding LytR/AlgR family response regulator|nr:LytTR family transcriptional regulator DNA-binding domain-containing protein [Acholeplasmatales bacterium]